jgi:hypothetical protein
MTIPTMQRAILSLEWLVEANRACQGQGFSHSYSPIFGWKPAYPETTGYIIPTLLKYHEKPEIRSHFSEKGIDLSQIAEKQAQWLCSLQLESGAFPGLLAGHTKPSVFNTGMILFGLSAILNTPSANFSPHSAQYLAAIGRAVNYLSISMDPDGIWRKDTYIVNFSPSYHIYALSGMLKGLQTLETRKENQLDLAHIKLQVQKALLSYQMQWNINGTVQNWSFWQDKPAYTHTIGYTLAGMLDVSLSLNDENGIALVERSIKALHTEYAKHGKIAGTYDQDWNGNNRFQCVTGHAQLACIVFQLAEVCQNTYSQFAIEILAEIAKTQRKTGTPRLRGALPGSYPIFGPYLRLRYPNWAAKYYLDALLYLD